MERTDSLDSFDKIINDSFTCIIHAKHGIRLSLVHYYFTVSSGLLHTYVTITIRLCNSQILRNTGYTNTFSCYDLIQLYIYIFSESKYNKCHVATFLPFIVTMSSQLGPILFYNLRGILQITSRLPSGFMSTITKPFHFIS